MKRLCCDGGLINIPPLLTYFYERLEQRVRVLVAEAEEMEHEAALEPNGLKLRLGSRSQGAS